ncbi:MAG: hypothetical protein ACE5HK_02575 [Candidatus Methylomirabilales bacterium]
MHWQVDLVGDAADLRMLADSLNGPDVAVVPVSDGYVLRAVEFAAASNAREVRVRAEKIITALSGATRLILGAHEPIKIGTVTQVGDDGSKYIFVSVEPAVARARAMPVGLTVIRRDGTVEHHRPADSINDLVPTILEDPAVEKALRLRNADALSWVELYRLYEVVEGDVSRSHIVGSGWAADSELTRFKHTANSERAAGDAARHGKEVTQPPKRAMTLSTARSLVDRILRAWIDWKSR